MWDVLQEHNSYGERGDRCGMSYKKIKVMERGDRCGMSYKNIIAMERGVIGVGCLTRK